MAKRAPVEIMQERASEVAGLLKTLSHPTRLLIACELRNRERSVGDLEESTGALQSALSRDLARMRAADLVKARRQSKSVYYRLSDARLERIIDALCDALGPASRRPKNRTRQ